MKFIRSLTKFSYDSRGLELELDAQHLMRIDFMEAGLVRVLMYKERSLELPVTWSIAPGARSVPYEGVPRDSDFSFATQAFDVVDDPHHDSIVVKTAILKLVIQRRPFYLKWYSRIFDNTLTHGVTEPQQQVEDVEPLLFSDRKTRPYMMSRQSSRHIHFTDFNHQQKFFGLGEKTGNMNRARRRFEMRNVDAMGYDAEFTDPLYKHIPIYYRVTPGGPAVGIFYDNMATATFDFGCEIDNYHERFCSYRAEAGDLNYWVGHAASLVEVVQKFSWLTGQTCLMPDWAWLYSGSGMGYTDGPTPQADIEAFIDMAESSGIPVGSFQLSSGYTLRDGKRYVFTWDTSRIPEPKQFVESVQSKGVRLAANIKPVLLKDHPLYDVAAQQQLFIRLTSEGAGFTPELSCFWDGEGSHLDFLNPNARRFWQQNIEHQLVDHGITALWNDNNEYEVWDDDAVCGPQKYSIANLRPVQTLLMLQTSRDALDAAGPAIGRSSGGPRLQTEASRLPGNAASISQALRWMISRSGMPGMQRYAQTWSGDNFTEWKTLRFNLRMSLSLSLCGIYNIGNDVGGFAGPVPEPELLLRWIQQGVFFPRLTLHSWKPNAPNTEPWMYPEILPLVREAFALRTRLIPHLKAALIKSHKEAVPILRPLFLNFPQDLKCYDEPESFMLGDSLLVATIMDPGVREHVVYLPHFGRAAGQKVWREVRTGMDYEGGQEVTLPVGWESIPHFEARERG